MLLLVTCITGNHDPVFQEMESLSIHIINAAVIKVLELHTSIIKGDITRRDLLKIMKKKKIMQELLLSANVEHDLNKYQERLNDFESHVNAVTTMLSNIDSDIEGNVICVLIVFFILFQHTGYKQIEMDVTYANDESRLMKDLCLNWYNNDDKNLIFQLLHGSPLYSILCSFSIMMIEYRCVIFHKILENCQNEHKWKFNGVITQQQFVNEVWDCCIEKCYILLTTCFDGSASVLELDELLFQDKQFGYVLDHDEIQLKLKALRDGLQHSFPDQPPPVPLDDQWVIGVSKKIESFRFSKDCCKIKTANYFLRLKNSLHYEGRYKFLEDLAEGVCAY